MTNIIFALVWATITTATATIRTERAKIYLSVYTKQQVTSSTLAWVFQNEVQKSNHEVVPIADSNLPWCRLEKNNLWVTGVVRNSVCEAPFFLDVVKSTKSQILVSLNGFARWKPVFSDGFSFPGKVVSSNDVILAYRDNPLYGYIAGYVDSNQRMNAFFIKNNRSVKENSANVIVEIEPVMYKLHHVQFTEIPETDTRDEHIENVRLENHDKLPKEIVRNVTFESLHRTYYGIVEGTIPGKNASVPSPISGSLNISWGCNAWDKSSNCIDNSYRRSYVIRRTIPGRSYVNVHLIAHIRMLEVPYQAELEAVFEDGETIVRNITSLHKEERMAELKGNFSPPYHLDYDYPLDGGLGEIQVFLHSSTTSTPIVMPDTNSGYDARISSVLCLLLLFAVSIL